MPASGIDAPSTWLTDFAIHPARRLDLGQQRARNLQIGQDVVVPVAPVDVVEQGAAGVARIGAVQRAAAQIPQQPRIDRPEGEFARFGPGADARHVIQQPRDFRAGEIGIRDQPGFRADRPVEPVRADHVAHRRGAAALPHDRVMDRLARLAIPEQRGFALVGDADRRHVRRADLLLIQHRAGHVALRAPDVMRIVFHPAGFGEMLRRIPAARPRSAGRLHQTGSRGNWSYPGPAPG